MQHIDNIISGDYRVPKNVCEYEHVSTTYIWDQVNTRSQETESSRDRKNTDERAVGQMEKTQLAKIKICPVSERRHRTKKLEITR